MAEQKVGEKLAGRLAIPRRGLFAPVLGNAGTIDVCQRLQIPNDGRSRSGNVDVLDEAELRDVVDAAILAAGGQSKFAAAHGLSKATVNAATTGRRTVGPKFLDAIGLEIVYRAAR